MTGSRAYVREAVRPWSSAATELAACAIDDAAEVLAGLPMPRYGATLTVVVGSALCRFLVMGRPPGIRDDAEARAVLQSHATKKLGLKEFEWTLTLDNRKREQIIGCALRSSTLALIHGWSAASNHRITSIRPLLATLSKTIGNGIVLETDAASIIVRNTSGVQMAAARVSDDEHDEVVERLRMNCGGNPLLPSFEFAERNEPGGLHSDFTDLFSERNRP